MSFLFVYLLINSFIFTVYHEDKCAGHILPQNKKLCLYIEKSIFLLLFFYFFGMTRPTVRFNVHVFM